MPGIPLIPADARMTTFPIARPDLWQWYLDAKKCFWAVEEVSVSQDVIDFNTRLSPGEQRFVKHVLAFFAASDGIVNVNLAERFKKDIPILEATYFYNYQMMTEDIHAHMYSVLLDAIVSDADERAELLNAAKTMPTVKRMSEFMEACIKSDAPLSERLLRMACVEGVFFTGCFCAIYWLAARGLMPGLSQSNELTAIDEAFHTIFAMVLNMLIPADERVSEARAIEIFTEAVGIGSEFVCESLPVGMTGMNADMMVEFIKSRADDLNTMMGHAPVFGASNPFPFMEQLNMTNRTNFFERRATEYNKITQTSDKYEIDFDF